MDRDDRDVNAASVIEAVLGWADRRPDQVAIGFRGASDWDAPLSYADLRRATFGAAGALSTAGVEPGDRVVLAVDTGCRRWPASSAPWCSARCR